MTITGVKKNAVRARDPREAQIDLVLARFANANGFALVTIAATRGAAPVLHCQ